MTRPLDAGCRSKDRERIHRRRAARPRAGAAVIVAVTAALLAGCSGGGDSAPVPRDASADLTALVVEQATLDPAFAADTYAYTGTVANAVASTRVVATARDAAATIRVNGTVVASGSASAAIALAEGANTVTTEVTGANGTTVRTYTVVVTRRPPPGTNPAVADLVLTVAPLDQLFDPDVTAYTASAGFFGTSTRVVAEPEDPNASLALDGDPLAGGVRSAPVPLAVGDNALALAATAEDGVTIRTYQIDVMRGTLAATSYEAYVKATNTDAGDRFGTALAFSGSTLVVGAPGEDSGARGIGSGQADNAQSGAGAAYLFGRTGSGWDPVAYVKASNAEALDGFGAAAAIDRDLLAVGATGEDGADAGIDGVQGSNTAASAGAVYAFERDGSGDWDQVAYLKASNAEANDEFGSAIAVDAGRVLVGAPLEDSAATGVDADGNVGDDDRAGGAGAAYLFGRNDAGVWRQLAYFKASNTESQDDFGRSVAIDGPVVAIGAPGEDSNARGVDGNRNDNSLVNAGAVYLFESDAGGTWSPAAYVKASRPASQDGFGSAVALDGDLLAVGAPGQNSGASGIDGNELDQSTADAGAVYVFERDAVGAWSQIAFVKAANPSAFDGFGSAVALSGNLLVVGAPGQNSADVGIDGDERDQSALNAGAVYLFERDAAGEWSQIAFVKASNTDAGDAFGAAAAVDGDTLVAGAPTEDSGSTGVGGDGSNDLRAEAGAVYVIR